MSDTTLEECIATYRSKAARYRAEGQAERADRIEAAVADVEEQLAWRAERGLDAHSTLGGQE